MNNDFGNLNVGDTGPLPLRTNCLYLLVSWTMNIYFGSEGPTVFIWKDVAWCETKLMSESLITLVKRVAGLFGIVRLITVRAGPSGRAV